MYPFQDPLLIDPEMQENLKQGKSKLKQTFRRKKGNKWLRKSTGQNSITIRKSASFRVKTKKKRLKLQRTKGKRETNNRAIPKTDRKPSKKLPRNRST